MGHIRGVLYDKLPKDVKQWVVDSKIRELSAVFNSNASLDFAKIYDFYNISIPLIQRISNNYPTVIKYYPAYVPGVKLIEWAKNNNFEIYFVTRRNFDEQLYSYMLADTKARFYNKIRDEKKVNLKGIAGFLNTNRTPKVVFPAKEIPKDIAVGNIITLCSIISGWHSYLASFREYGKIVYYEDSVAVNDFNAFGITDEMFQRYCKLNHSLRPTHSYTIGEQISNWDEILEISKHYYPPKTYE